VQAKFGDERRTEIIEDEGEFSIEDLIADEDVAITVTDTGYIKRTPISTYRNQRRGGKGRIGMRTREEDVVNHLFVASTHSYMMVFSDRGRAYWLKVHEIPDVGADGRGKSIANLVQMEPARRSPRMLPCASSTTQHFVVMGTRKGTVKKTELSAFSNPRAGGIIAMGIDEGDAVMAVQLSDGASEVFIGTRDGMAIRFPEGDVRPMGRTAYGVRGIQLREGDEVVAMEVAKPGGTLLTVTERGYASGPELDEYRVRAAAAWASRTSRSPTRTAGREHRPGPRRRGTAGHHRAGQDPADAGGRHPHGGRATQGVRLMDLEGHDRVVSIAHDLVQPDEE
jgi:DNA gyrase subunit A